MLVFPAIRLKAIYSDFILCIGLQRWSIISLPFSHVQHSPPIIGGHIYSLAEHAQSQACFLQAANGHAPQSIFEWRFARVRLHAGGTKIVYSERLTYQIFAREAGPCAICDARSRSRVSTRAPGPISVPDRDIIRSIRLFKIFPGGIWGVVYTLLVLTIHVALRVWPQFSRSTFYTYTCRLALRGMWAKTHHK